MRVSIERSVPVSNSYRVRALEAMFDAPKPDVSVVTWSGEIDFPEEWSVGLIVGPSGSGKSTLAKELFGPQQSFRFAEDSVIDDFSPDNTMTDIADVCQAVGFNTIPSWMRPYRVLSTGEQFRVEIARHLLDADRSPIVIDEFTSVVDRQVAQITSHAVQKWIRAHPSRKFVAVSCHYDIIDWLQPDWVIEMPTMSLERRSVQRRPDLAVQISRVPYTAWAQFAPFHYLTADLNPSAKCFCLFVVAHNDIPVPAAFCATLHRPHAHVDDIEGISRIVTLPDWQGIGLGPALLNTVASAFTALGKRFHNYPAHPAFVRGHDNSPLWALIKRPGQFSPRKGSKSTLSGTFGGRPCAVFRYVGPAMDRTQAETLIRSWW